MTTQSPLETADLAIVDTTVFARLTAAEFRRLRDETRSADVTLRLPERVVEELENGYATLSDHEEKLYQTAIDEGWAIIVEPPPIQQSDATTARDIARRTIASRDEMAEHEVETTDPVLAGLAVEYVTRRAASDGIIAVITDDRGARFGVSRAIEEVGFGDRVRAFTLPEIIGGDPGEITII